MLICKCLETKKGEMTVPVTVNSITITVFFTLKKKTKKTCLLKHLTLFECKPAETTHRNSPMGVRGRGGGQLSPKSDQRALSSVTETACVPEK